MPPCPICSGPDPEPLWSVDRYRLARCLECRHVFVSAGFDPAELEGAYEKGYYEAGRDASPAGYQDYLAGADVRLRGFAQRLQQLERHVAARGRLLDYGCAVGLFVKVAGEAGWQATGLERSAWAARFGRERFGVDIVVAGGDEDTAFAGRFDVVTMWDVLEHLEDPRAALASVARWLKPGGLLALNTVDAGSYGARRAGPHWRHIAPPHHLHYFTRRSLVRALEAAGMQLLATRSQGVMWSADRRTGQLHGARHVIEELATHWRTRPLANALNLLDEVEIVAVRAR
jgi:SAM-dependent methyltransferase